MKKYILIAPSLLSADFSKLGKEVVDVSNAGADWIHFDIMDGLFVPNITMGPGIVRSVRGLSSKTFDVHLMIEDPYKFVGEFAKAGADIITFHVEACKDPLRTIKAIKANGTKAGISIKPKTPVSAITKFLHELDLILVMTVEPGFGGQSFMKDMMPKIEDLKKIFDNDIEVDGGINDKTAKEAVTAGANVLVAGTAVFGDADYAKAIRRLKSE